MVCPLQAYSQFSAFFTYQHLYRPGFSLTAIRFNPLTPHSISVFELSHVQTSLNASVPEAASRPFADLTSSPCSFGHQRPPSGDSHPSALGPGDGPLPLLAGGASFLLLPGFVFKGSPSWGREAPPSSRLHVLATAKRASTKDSHWSSRPTVHLHLDNIRAPDPPDSLASVRGTVIHPSS